MSSGDIMVRKERSSLGSSARRFCSISFKVCSSLLLKNINDHLWKGAPNSGRG
ncbi:hypothetical protein MINT15_35250 [Saccharomonospora viridis]|uniref:Uncharacterized protein n=1 Tax=Saccharomonospora viridis TaxID=1852 RepID=A0A837D6C6_9PSEU|nr:hypothetical protein MINT15_35250 [Saccharomonospora viridis]